MTIRDLNGNVQTLCTDDKMWIMYNGDGLKANQDLRVDENGQPLSKKRVSNFGVENKKIIIANIFCAYISL